MRGFSILTCTEAALSPTHPSLILFPTSPTRPVSEGEQGLNPKQIEGSPKAYIIKEVVPPETEVLIQNLKTQVSDLSEKLEQTEAQLKDAKKDTTEHKEEDDKKKRSVFARSSTINLSEEQHQTILKLQTELSESQTSISDLKAELEATNAKNHTLVIESEKSRREKDKEIKNLKDEMDVYVDTIEEKNKEIKDIKEEMDKLNHEINERH